MLPPLLPHLLPLLFLLSSHPPSVMSLACWLLMCSVFTVKRPLPQQHATRPAGEQFSRSFPVCSSHSGRIICEGVAKLPLGFLLFGGLGYGTRSCIASGRESVYVCVWMWRQTRWWSEEAAVWASRWAVGWVYSVCLCCTKVVKSWFVSPCWARLCVGPEQRANTNNIGEFSSTTLWLLDTICAIFNVLSSVNFISTVSINSF